VSVGRYTAKGNNVLSVNHKDDNGNLTNVLTAQLQDGILSAAKYSDQTKELSLFFNATNPANAMISVSLSGLADTYTAGEGLTLTDSRFALSAATATSFGGIKVGSGLHIDENGVLSASGASSNPESLTIGNVTYNGSAKCTISVLTPSLTASNGDLADALGTAKSIESATSALLEQKEWTIDSATVKVNASNVATLKSNVQSNWNATTGDAVILNRPTLASVATSGSYSDLTGKPSLATVATSGSYNDLTNKPTIPLLSYVRDIGFREWRGISSKTATSIVPRAEDFPMSGGEDEFSVYPILRVYNTSTSSNTVEIANFISTEETITCSLGPHEGKIFMLAGYCLGRLDSSLCTVTANNSSINIDALFIAS